MLIDPAPGLARTERGREAFADMPFAIRDVSPNRADREYSFVHETTQKIRWPNTGHNAIPWREWREMTDHIVARWMLQGRVRVVDAGSGVLLGYQISMGESTVAALYVKASFRGRRIGLALLKDSNLSIPYRAYAPTRSWTRWAQVHGVPWERHNHGKDRDEAIVGI